MQSARERWFERLHAERERRRDSEFLVDGRDPREVLLAELDEMGQRMRAHPHYEPPDPEESSRILKKWFKERFGR
jgi:hypothetical protein